MNRFIQLNVAKDFKFHAVHAPLVLHFQSPLPRITMQSAADLGIWEEIRDDLHLQFLALLRLRGRL